MKSLHSAMTLSSLALRWEKKDSIGALSREQARADIDWMNPSSFRSCLKLAEVYCDPDPSESSHPARAVRCRALQSCPDTPHSPATDPCVPRWLCQASVQQIKGDQIINVYDLPFISPGFCETGAKISASNTSYILKYADFVRKRKYFGPSQGPF